MGQVMQDPALYTRTLTEFAGELLTPYDVQLALRRLTDRVSEVLGLAGSGVSLARGERLEFDTADAAEIAAVEQVQEKSQTGPCVTAFRSGHVVATSDLRREAARWPEFCAAAAAVHLTSVSSIPMRLGARRAGALNLYAHGHRDWSEEDLAAARVMANMATAYVINASYHRQQVELNRQLQHALDRRVVIEQAKGMLAARHGIAVTDAYERLRSCARSRSEPVAAVATAVVDAGLQL